MPGIYCSVAACKNTRVKTVATPGKADVMYHRFPKEENIRNQWIERCGREGKQWNSTSCHICSEHFTPEDYERDLVNELLGLPQKRKLKKGSVPSLNLVPAPVPVDPGSAQPSRRQRSVPKKRQRTQKRQTRKKAKVLFRENAGIQMNDTKVENLREDVEKLRDEWEEDAEEV